MEPNQFQANSSPSMPVGNTNPPPVSDVRDMTPASHEHKKVGPIVAILVIVIVLVIAALYIFASRMNSAPDQIQVPTTNTAANQQVQAPRDNTPVAPPTIPAVTNKATDVQSLENDLNVSTQGLDGQAITQ